MKTIIELLWDGYGHCAVIIPKPSHWFRDSIQPTMWFEMDSKLQQIYWSYDFICKDSSNSFETTEDAFELIE